MERLLKRRERLVPRLLQVRAFGHAKSHGPWLSRRRRSRRRVLTVPAVNDHRCEGAKAGKVGGHQADVIECLRDQNRPVGRQPAVRRLERAQPVERCGSVDRATRLRAERDVAEPCCTCRRRTLR
eukprot:4050035-Prymnesium_polylepis.1